MTNQASDTSHQPFSSAFFNALGKAMSLASDSSWLISALPDDDRDSDKIEPVWIRLVLNGSLSGEFLLEFQRNEAALLASKFLGEGAEEFTAEHGEALLKTVKASLSEFSSALEQEFGAFTVKAFRSTAPPSERTNEARMTAADGEGNRISVVMILDKTLAQALHAHAHPESASATVAQAIKAVTRRTIPQPENLNLVMDVELNVTLRFGQRKLTLREVLDLTTGSVVELDRQVEEPVELLLDGVVIARGEAVVIDGNYGLRVTEVSRAVTTPMLH